LGIIFVGKRTMTDRYSGSVAADRQILRILDANLDRAREGLRIVEEWCRFGLDNSSLAQECKDLRQQLAALHTADLRAARNTTADVGTQLSHPQEETRENIDRLLIANLCRIQEALRVLEEYSKLYNPSLSASCKQMRYRVYILESAIDESKIPAKMAALIKAKIYLVTMPVPDLLGTVEKALHGGLKLVQYRRKEGDDIDRLREAKALCELCHRYGALFISNDRVDLAVAVGADGVHLGQNDLPVDTARQILGRDKIVGRSTTSPAEMAKALAEGANYIGVGPVHETPTKAGKAASGLEYVRYAVQHSTVPWFAIGGIDHTNVGDVVAAGAPGVAVVRSIMQANDPGLIVREMLAKFPSNSLELYNITN
jgi:thiamine-phosphate pyrophosphorylase